MTILTILVDGKHITLQSKYIRHHSSQNNKNNNKTNNNNNDYNINNSTTQESNYYSEENSTRITNSKVQNQNNLSLEHHINKQIKQSQLQQSNKITHFFISCQN